MKEQKYFLSTNIILIALVLILIGLGLGFLYSASHPISVKMFDKGYSIFLKQLIYFAAGFAAFILGSLINHNIYRKFTKIMIFITLIMLIFILIPGVSREVGGGKRWLSIGFTTFQPSEIAKFVIILYLASVLSNKKEDINDFYKGVLPPLIMTGLISFLIFLENDFSTTFLLLLLVFVVLYLSEVKLFTLMMLVGVGMVTSLLMVVIAPYRLKRMFAFLNPWDDPLGSGWQYIQSAKCFTLGKMFGVGIGESAQKNSALPEAHNDYIFAVISEEGGAVIAILIILLFLVISFLGFNIAKRSDNKYSFLVASGISSLILLQAFVNIGVVIGVLPSTGITLPFISAGGTSLVMFMLMVGVLLNVSAKGRSTIPLKEVGS